jgi:N-acetylglucosamine-6-phosphate deacetylase
MTRMVASRVVTLDGILEGGAVEVSDGRVTAVGPAHGTVPDRTLVPGFVDIQVNGVDDVDVADADGDDWERLDHLLLAQGVTTWCPTLVTAPLGSYTDALDRVAAAGRRPAAGRPHIAGVHLEGPFLGGAPGAHPVELLAPVDLAWLADLPPIVAIVTIAPEVEAAADAIRLLAGRGVLVSLGHSTASYEEALAGADAGARLVTHLFNGMGPLHHRRPGLVGAALADDRLAVSVIADLVHVHPAALRAAFAAKGAAATVLVTDSVAWRRPIHATRAITIGDDGAPRLRDGTLAGSALTMDAAVRHVIDEAGVTLDDAIAAASTTPARLLGLDDRGAISPGRRADIVALSPSREVEAVWIGGEQAYG